jgi:hypothetical protein
LGKELVVVKWEVSDTFEPGIHTIEHDVPIALILGSDIFDRSRPSVPPPE